MLIWNIVFLALGLTRINSEPFGLGSNAEGMSPMGR